ncbi:MAG: hypothetical protein ACRDT1_00400, partial [Micromonosporaceae bacterium]
VTLQDAQDAIRSAVGQANAHNQILPAQVTIILGDGSTVVFRPEVTTLQDGTTSYLRPYHRTLRHFAAGDPAGDQAIRGEPWASPSPETISATRPEQGAGSDSTTSDSTGSDTETDPDQGFSSAQDSETAPDTQVRSAVAADPTPGSDTESQDDSSSTSAGDTRSRSQSDTTNDTDSAPDPESSDDTDTKPADDTQPEPRDDTDSESSEESRSRPRPDPTPSQTPEQMSELRQHATDRGDQVSITPEGDSLGEVAPNIGRRKGWLQVVIHGSRDGVLFNGRLINTSDLAKIIRSTEMWGRHEADLQAWRDNGEQGDRPKPPNIDLVSCGIGPEFAARLREELGVDRVDTTPPGSYAWIYPDGRVVFAPAIIGDDGNIAPDLSAATGAVSYGPEGPEASTFLRDAERARQRGRYRGLLGRRMDETRPRLLEEPDPSRPRPPPGPPLDIDAELRRLAALRSDIDNFAANHPDVRGVSAWRKAVQAIENGLKKAQSDDSSAVQRAARQRASELSQLRAVVDTAQDLDGLSRVNVRVQARIGSQLLRATVDAVTDDGATWVNTFDDGLAPIGSRELAPLIARLRAQTQIASANRGLRPDGVPPQIQLRFPNGVNARLAAALEGYVLMDPKTGLPLAPEMQPKITVIGDRVTPVDTSQRAEPNTGPRGPVLAGDDTGDPDRDPSAVIRGHLSRVAELRSQLLDLVDAYRVAAGGELPGVDGLLRTLEGIASELEHRLGSRPENQLNGIRGALVDLERLELIVNAAPGLTDLARVDAEVASQIDRDQFRARVDAVVDDGAAGTWITWLNGVTTPAGTSAGDAQRRHALEQVRAQVQVALGVRGPRGRGGVAPRIELRFPQGVDAEFAEELEGLLRGVVVVVGDRRTADDSTDQAGTSDIEPSSTQDRERAILEELSAEEQAALRDAVAAARPVADTMARHLREIGDEINDGLPDDQQMGLLGEEHRVKGLGSLARKFATEYGPFDVAVQEFLAATDDLVRFSVRSPDGERYGSTVSRVIAELEARGYEILSQENYWQSGNSFFGFAAYVRVRRPDDGRVIEIQFPTANSWDVSKRTHSLYETVRLPSVSPDLRMHAMLRNLQIVKEADLDGTLPDVSGLPDPLSLNFAMWMQSQPALVQAYRDWLSYHGVTFVDVLANFGLGLEDLPGFDAERAFGPHAGEGVGEVSPPSDSDQDQPDEPDDPDNPDEPGQPGPAGQPDRPGPGGRPGAGETTPDTESEAALGDHDLEPLQQLSQEERSALQDAVDAARLVADRVLADLGLLLVQISRDLPDDQKLYSLGAEHRVKTIESLAHEYVTRYRPAGWSLSTFLARSGDLVRFAVETPAGEHYGASVNKVLSELRSQGYQVVAPPSNVWKSGNLRLGFTAYCRGPGGQVVEIEFPTSLSWELADRTRDLRHHYQRESEPPLSRVDAALSIIQAYKDAGAYEQPLNLTGLPAPSDFGFADWARRQPDMLRQYADALEAQGMTFVDHLNRHGLELFDLPGFDPYSVFAPERVAAPGSTAEVQLWSLQNLSADTHAALRNAVGLEGLAALRGGMRAREDAADTTTRALTSIIEGVNRSQPDSDDQMAVVDERRVTVDRIAQGWLFSRVKSLAEIRAWLEGARATYPTRLSVVVPGGERYGPSVRGVIDQLTERGYRESSPVQNFWKPGNTRVGLVAHLVGPDGQQVQIEFHTAPSWDLEQEGRTRSLRLQATRASDPPILQVDAMLELTRIVRDSGLYQQLPELDLSGFPEPEDSNFGSWANPELLQWYAESLRSWGATFEDQLEHHGLELSDLSGFDPSQVFASPTSEVSEEGQQAELWVLGQLPHDALERLKRLVDDAHYVSGVVHTELDEVVETVNSRHAGAEPIGLVGQEHRVKSITSLARGYVTAQALHGSSVDNYVKGTDDLVRFSVQVPSGAEYGSVVSEVLAELAALGYEPVRELENHWKADNTHLGFTAYLSGPGDQVVEIRFPTAESWRVGNQTRELREQIQRSHELPVARVEAWLQILQIIKDSGLAGQLPDTTGLPAPTGESFASWIDSQPAVREAYAALLKSLGMTLEDHLAYFGLEMADVPGLDPQRFTVPGDSTEITSSMLAPDSARLAELSPEESVALQRAVEQASTAKAAVSGDLRAVLNEAGLAMLQIQPMAQIPLASLVRHFLTEHAPLGVTLDEFLAQTYELVRYQVVCPTGFPYGDTVTSVLRGLESQGYQIDRRENYWRPGNIYLNFVAYAREPRTGQRLEIEFPTDWTSLEGNLPRDLRESPERGGEPQGVMDRMLLHIQAMKAPAEVTELPDLSGLPEPQGYTFANWARSHPVFMRAYATWLRDQGTTFQEQLESYGLDLSDLPGFDPDSAFGVTEGESGPPDEGTDDDLGDAFRGGQQPPTGGPDDVSQNEVAPEARRPLPRRVSRDQDIQHHVHDSGDLMVITEVGDGFGNHALATGAPEGWVRVAVHGQPESPTFRDLPFLVERLARIIKQGEAWQKYESQLSEWRRAGAASGESRPEPPRFALLECYAAQQVAGELSELLGDDEVAVTVAARHDVVAITADGAMYGVTGDQDRYAIVGEDSQSGWYDFTSGGRTPSTFGEEAEAARQAELQQDERLRLRQMATQLTDQEREALRDAVSDATTVADQALRALADILLESNSTLPSADEMRLLDAVEDSETRSRDRRVKPLVSLTVKFLTNYALHGVSVGTFLGEVEDLIRFRVQVSPEHYGPSVTRVLQELQAQGYTIDPELTQNYWKAGNIHLGFTGYVRSPSGQLIEIQFPTADSHHSM